MAAAPENVFSKEKASFPNLYELESAIGKIHLLGTNHAFPLAQIPGGVLVEIEKRLLASEVVFMEGIYKKTTFQKLHEKGFFMGLEEEDWFSLLSVPEREKIIFVIEALKARHQIAFEINNLYIPAVCALIVQNIFESGMDTQLQIKYANRKTIIALDAITDHEEMPLSEMDALPRTLNDLKSFLNSHFFNPEHAKLFKAAQEAYLLGKSPDLDDEEIDEVNYRNRKWKRTIMKALREGKIPFVAVGFAHLEHGLLALFKQEGFTVKKVNIPSSFLPLNTTSQMREQSQGSTSNSSQTVEPKVKIS